MADRHLFPSKLADLNIQFNTDMTFLNLPAVGTNPSTATRLSITPANLQAANTWYSNPNPVMPQTSPTNLGWKEPRHQNKANKRFNKDKKSRIRGGFAHHF